MGLASARADDALALKCLRPCRKRVRRHAPKPVFQLVESQRSLTEGRIADILRTRVSPVLPLMVTQFETAQGLFHPFIWFTVVASGC
jgi:hypothetical protein